jgi:hypothetical protein
MKRGQPLTRKTPLRQRSKKMAKKYAGPDGRAAFVARLLRKRWRCEAGPLLWPCGVDVVAYRDGHRQRRTKSGAWVLACTGRSAHVHEPLTRARGGAIDDAVNAVAVCALCHDRIHTHPLEAAELGLLHCNARTPTTAPRAT